MVLTRTTARRQGARRHGRARPILVTGMPRSGTTWLARELANCPGTALPGREPMNPKDGQYGLGGTLARWTRLAAPTERQLRLLRLSYAGLNPRVYSRYGFRQWSAPLPWVRVVVKDPFALLSLPTIVRETGALPIIVYRHPAAVLASYRRMGWTADQGLSDLQHDPDLQSLAATRTVPPETPPELAGVAQLWNGLYAAALHDSREVDVLIVSHEELAAGGPSALATVLQACDLRQPRRHTSQQREEPVSPHRLHNLRRDPATVAASWRDQLPEQEVQLLELLTGPVQQQLQRHRLILDGHDAAR